MSEDNSVDVVTENYDVMTLIPEKTIFCLDKGMVKLVDCMPRLVPLGQTCDQAIFQAARVSYGDGTKKFSEDRGLIRYLMRHQHTTPTEMVEFKFHCKMPIFIARQWIRHRTANVNEISGRYSILKDEFYFPEADKVSLQSTANRQGGGLVADNMMATEFISYLESHCAETYAKYKDYADVKEISREQARMNLPLNIYTEWYWKIDLHNLFHFLALRCDAHAQYEIRVFADAMLKLITPVVPFAVEAWNDYHFRRDALLLTRLEVESLKEVLAGVTAKPITTDNKREQAEWKIKLARLGLTSFAE